jgi:multidrug efflux pump subunit AcrA (membrane-fusion protein)
VRARVNQADAPLLRHGQTAAVELEAYPGKRFTATLQSLTPAAVTSVMSPRIRWMTATLAVDQTDALLLPDLTAIVDLILERHENALVVPRESLVSAAGGTTVDVMSGDDWTATPVTLGPVGDTEAVIAAGLQEGMLVRRRTAGVAP